MPIRSDGEETRSRILLAAGEAFGRYGFKRVTNRIIADLSKANTAAVSYYFRDKGGLYREVWNDLQEASSNKYVALLEEEGKENGNGKLKKFCKALFDWLYDPECWDSEIWRYEMSEPSGELENPQEDKVACPLKLAIASSISSLVGEEEDSLAVRLAVQTIVAGMRSGFDVDGLRASDENKEEYFELLYQAFSRSLGITDSKGIRKATKKKELDEHPELGVADEVDFSLKHVCQEEVIMMRKVEERKKAEPVSEEEEPEDDTPSFLQQELW